MKLYYVYFCDEGWPEILATDMKFERDDALAFARGLLEQGHAVRLEEVSKLAKLPNGDYVHPDEAMSIRSCSLSACDLTGSVHNLRVVIDLRSSGARVVIETETEADLQGLADEIALALEEVKL